MSIVSTQAAISASDVRTGMSVNQDISTAVEELRSQIFQPDASFVTVFVSPRYDLKQLGPFLKKSFNGTPVIGCTTAGEITPQGYCENSLTGFSISGNHTRVKLFTIDSLRDFKPSALQTIQESAKNKFAGFLDDNSNAKEFAVLFIDGMSGAEEKSVAGIHQILGNIPLIGGSAGDNLKFERTWVLVDGQFRSDIAILALVSTTLPFQTFKTQHFIPTRAKLVITEADPSTRTVFEINGLPAADEYARSVGIQVDELVPTVFSKYPIMLKIGGEYYVRSLQKKNEDGSLKFYCAIDNGLVLTVGQGVDIVENLQQELDHIALLLNKPQLLITCECVLRRLEVIQKGLTDQIGNVLMNHNAIGFHSYGEQFNAIHVNQTFSGVMLGHFNER